jgi:hypothetical protein
MIILRNILCIALIMLSAGCVTGGSNQDGEYNRLASEAATMGRTDLEATIAKYKTLIAEKTDVANQLKSKLQEVPLADMMGEKAQALKGSLRDTMASIQQLKEQLAVYTDALKAFEQ